MNHYQKRNTLEITGNDLRTAIQEAVPTLTDEEIVDYVSGRASPTSAMLGAKFARKFYEDGK